MPDLIVNHCCSILEGYLGGQAGATAIVDLILGKVCPSGKLPETFPKKQSDIPSDVYFPGTRHSVEYREGLQVGYRYFNSPQFDKMIRFPFGHGMSHTTFEYQNCKVDVIVDGVQNKTFFG